MGVRANWFLDAMPLDDGDPFAAVQAPPGTPVQEVGIPFDLRDPGPLQHRAVELLRWEAELHERGVICAVKQRPDSACTACTHAHDSDPNHTLYLLCNVGREQERVLTEQAHRIEERKDAH